MNSLRRTLNAGGARISDRDRSHNTTAKHLCSLGHACEGQWLHVAPCTSFKRSKSQRSCPGCILPDISMESLSTVLTQVSPGTEQDAPATNEEPYRGGGPFRGDQFPVGTTERCVDIGCVKFGPPPKYSSVPRIHPPVAIQKKKMIYGG